jgi:hypothetical protein
MAMQHLRDRQASETYLAKALEGAERQRARHAAAATAWEKERQTLADQLDAARAEQCTRGYGLQCDLRQARDALEEERRRSDKLVKQMRTNTSMLQRLENIDRSLHEDQGTTPATSHKQNIQQPEREKQPRRPWGVRGGEPVHGARERGCEARGYVELGDDAVAEISYTSAGSTSQRATSGGSWEVVKSAGALHSGGGDDVTFAQDSGSCGDAPATAVISGVGDGDGDGADVFNTLTGPKPERHTPRSGAGFSLRRTSSAGTARSPPGGDGRGLKGASPYNLKLADAWAQRSIPIGGGSWRSGRSGNGGGAGDGEELPSQAHLLGTITAQVHAAIVAAATDQAAGAWAESWAGTGEPHASPRTGYNRGGGGSTPGTSSPRPQIGRARSPTKTADDWDVRRGGRRRGVTAAGASGVAGGELQAPGPGGQQRQRLIFGGGFMVQRKSVMELREKEAGRRDLSMHNPETLEDTSQRPSVSRPVVVCT